MLQREAFSGIINGRNQGNSSGLCWLKSDGDFYGSVLKVDVTAETGVTRQSRRSETGKLAMRVAFCRLAS